jgi:hypothetical protein
VRPMRLAKPSSACWATYAHRSDTPKPTWIGRSSRTLAGSDVEPGGAESAHLVGVTVVEEDAGSSVHSCDGGHLVLGKFEVEAVEVLIERSLRTDFGRIPDGRDGSFITGTDLTTERISRCATG